MRASPLNGPAEPSRSVPSLNRARSSTDAPGVGRDSTGIRSTRGPSARPPAPVSWRSVVALAVVSVVLVAAVVVVPLQLSTAALRSAAEDRVSSTTSVAAFTVARRLDSLGGLVGAFAADQRFVDALAAPATAPADPALLQQLADQLQASNPQIRHASVLDPAGRLVAISPPVPAALGADFSFRDYFVGATSRPGPYVSRVYVAKLPDAPLLANAAVAIRTPAAAGGQLLGVLTASYDVAEDLQSWVDALAATDQVGLTVTDQDGAIVAAPGAPTSGFGQGGDDALVRRLEEPGVVGALRGRVGSALVDRDAQAQLAAYAPVPGIGWTVSTAMPEAQAYAPAARLRTAVLAVAAVLGVVLGLCLLGLVRAVRVQAGVTADLARAAADSSAALVRERAAAEQLREVDQAKDRFLSSVSHELRTPLASMIGYTELLEDGEIAPLTGPQQHAVGVIRRNGVRLLGLVEDLMAYTQLTTGTAALTLEAVPVARLLATATARIGQDAAAKGQELTVDVDPATPDVHGDVVHLDRLLSSVATNAVKFTPAGGRVTLRAAPHTDDRGGRWVRIQVIDTGQGIPAHEQHQVFTRFYRSEAALRDAVAGTGLGLGHAAAITAAHSGTIALASVPGEGTTVTVHLPASSPAPAPRTEVGSAPAATAAGGQQP